MCECVDVLPGSHANTVTFRTPKHLIGVKLGCYTFRETTCVDRCIADEVQRLWSLGIATTGSCCGHNVVPGYIGVMERYIPRMKALGYRVRPNEMHPTREDGFYPTSTGDTVNTNEIPTTAEMPPHGHHWRDGWWFRRLEGGAVQIDAGKDGPRVMIPAAEWDSIFREVAIGGPHA